jgi:RNA polymerase sigma-70 factor, ECF subfamily
MELCLEAKVLKSRPQDSAAEMALVDRCRKQDAEAFAKLVDAYQNRVYGFVRRMVSDQEDAADVAQEVFIRAFQGMSRFDGRSSLRTWLFRIAYNLCVDRARKLDRAPDEMRIEATQDDEQPFEISDSRWNPESLVMDDELFAVVEKSIESMSEKLRSVLLLHDREDFAYDEIAETLNVPVGTVKSRLFLARAQLQQALSAYFREGATHGS